MHGFSFLLPIYFYYSTFFVVVVGVFYVLKFSWCVNVEHTYFLCIAYLLRIICVTINQVHISCRQVLREYCEMHCMYYSHWIYYIVRCEVWRRLSLCLSVFLAYKFFHLFSVRLVCNCTLHFHIRGKTHERTRCG